MTKPILWARQRTVEGAVLSLALVGLGLVLVWLGPAAAGAALVNLVNVGLSRQVGLALGETSAGVCDAIVATSLPRASNGSLDLSRLTSGPVRATMIRIADLGSSEHALGRVACSLRDWPTAELHLRAAAQARPQSAVIHYELGSVLWAQGKVEPAWAAWRQAGAEVSFVREGFEAYARQDWEPALASFEKAIQTRPDYAEGYRGRGLVLVFGFSRPADGLADLERAKNLGLDERSAAWIDVEIAHVRTMVGDYDGALALLRTAPDQDHFVLMLRGQAHWRRGELTDASRAFQESLRLAPRNLWSRYGLGRVYWELGQVSEACAQWERVRSIDPEFGPATEALQQGRQHGLCW